MSGLLLGDDGLSRCAWCGVDAQYRQYHDEEWGRLVLDDSRQFEFIILESAQAGLSWLTILRKREAYRKAFAHFDASVIAGWNEENVLELLDNPNIVRNRKKIESAIGNARAFVDFIEKRGCFAHWLLDFYGGKPQKNRPLSDVPVSTQISKRISKELKGMGFRFFGPIIAYAHLQAVGIVDDHLLGCHVCERPAE